MMNIYIIGVGLIGGSFAMSLKKEQPDFKFFGIDKNKSYLTKAKELGIIDATAKMEEIANADMVYLAIPVDASLKILPEILDLVNDNCLVMDAGSTKQDICGVVVNHKKRRNFLGTHPIAGTEFSGPTAAINNLFKNKTNIICEVGKTAFRLQEKALDIFQKLGMHIRYMDPAAHDRHIAYVSHLSHISSFMLGKTVLKKEENERDIFDLAGSGFASTVRLAKSSPAMWTPIFKQNKTNILESLDEFISNLQDFKQHLESDNYSQVFKEMQEINHIKTVLNGITEKDNLNILENGK